MRSLILKLVDLTPPFVARLFRGDGLLARIVRPLINRLFRDSTPQPVKIRSGAAEGMRIVAIPSREKYYWTGLHDVHVQEALVKLLRPGMTFWDVGAHAGLFTLIGSRLVGEDGKVVSFEPMPETAQRLASTVAANGLGNVEVGNFALAREGGEAMLREGVDSTMWSLEADRPGVAERGHTVRTLSIADASGRYGKPDLIKVDAEGTELEILRGGMQLFVEAPPTMIVEFLDESRLASARDEFSDTFEFALLADKDWLLTPRDA